MLWRWMILSTANRNRYKLWPFLTATAFPINNSALGDSRSDFAVFRLGVVSGFVLQSSPKRHHERAHIKRAYVVVYDVTKPN